MPSIALDKPGAVKRAGRNAGMCHPTDAAGAHSPVDSETQCWPFAVFSADTGQPRRPKPFWFLVSEAETGLPASPFRFRTNRNDELLSPQLVSAFHSSSYV
jgi:hypothetical protein